MPLLRPGWTWRARRRLRALMFTLMLLAFVVLAGRMWETSEASVAVRYVKDGDSFSAVIDGEVRDVRLEGIDAPELSQTCQRADGGEWPCGREARAALVALLNRGALQCSLRARDRYQRHIALCTQDAAQDSVNAAMVRSGMAVANGDSFLWEESEATSARRGVWQGEFVTPAEWRSVHKLIDS